MSKLDGFIKQFLAESYENLDKLDRTLVELEKDPRAADKLANIFRIVHSLKGTAAFFSFTKLEALTHAGEGLLARLRDGVLLLNAEITSGLLSMVDAVRQMLSNVEKTGGEGDEGYSAVLQRLTSLYNSSPGPAKPAPSPEQQKPTQGVAAAPRLGELLVEANVIEEKDMAQVLVEQLNGDPRLIGEILIEQGLAKSEDVVDALNKQSQAQSSSAVSNIRIDVEHLDRLMNLAGELVLARNQILQFSSAHQDAGLTSATQRLNLITSELQEGIMKARMQPIENIWSKFPRVVRDLANLFGKKVRLEMEGSDTELDRTIIEAIRDPLTHLVRNCVDHGIESPEKRIASGKPGEGRLLLRAFHEGGQVNIEISDDGAGIDAHRLRRKAVELNLISSEQVQRLDERAALNLIFLPGFSTAEKITAVSGRGVGMDVVKTNIEKIGGMAEVESKLGEGTTLKIRIPLTLAIIPALIVTGGGQRYAIPQTSVLELVRLAAEKAAKGIEMIHGAPVYRLRESLLPLIYLNRELEISTASATGVQQNGAPANAVSTNIVVLRANNRRFGLVVDEVNDTGEIVVKPLGKRLKGISIFAGATIMGDGRVALILDVSGLARSAHVLSQASVQKQMEMKAPAHRAKEDQQSLLLFTTASGSPMVIPLSQVTRLEEFPSALLEWTGDHEMVQYQGQILPLVDLNSLLPGRQTATISNATGDTIKVVVYSSKDRRVGLKIGQILDIIEDRLSIQHPSSRRGSLGSVVIHGRIAEVVDMNEVLALEAVHTAMSAAAVASEGKSPELVS